MRSLEVRGLIAHLIIVEDDEVDEMFIKRALKGQDNTIKTTFVRRAEAALELLLAGASDRYVVLTDIRMPGLGGQGLIEKIRGDASISSTLVYILTSSNNTEEIKAAYAAGVQGYFVKPDSGLGLKETLGTLCDYLRTVAMPY